ncbi:MAG: hypothetical protein LBG97_02500 [Coriobacteriales bacterium]|jgi:hypothetical protein|nr:hypothetical protein [Coriobacteriales bacterium]
MGLLDLLLGKPQQIDVTPAPLSSPMPQVAIDEVRNGRLPKLKTTKIILKQAESLHWYDPAVLTVEKIKKQYVRHSGGTSFKGLFGMRHYTGNGTTDVIERPTVQQFPGVLYITNKRVLFHAPNGSFDKPLSGLSAINPYANAIDLQFNTKTYRLYVPNGGIIADVINLVTQ